MRQKLEEISGIWDLSKYSHVEWKMVDSLTLEVSTYTN